MVPTIIKMDLLIRLSACLVKRNELPQNPGVYNNQTMTVYLRGRGHFLVCFFACNESFIYLDFHPAGHYHEAFVAGIIQNNRATP